MHILDAVVARREVSAARALCSRGSRSSFHRRLLASLAGGTALVGAASAAQAGSPAAVPANMLPQGGHFVAGTGSIGTQGLTETITQTSQRGIIDFNSFSIGKSGTVKINNGMGATLDRVTGGSLSQIMGILSATGSVFDAAHTGNRFVYAQSETLTVTPTGANTTTVTYDGMAQTAASNPTGFAFTGFIGSDTQANAVTGTASVTGGSGRNVGTYAFTADVSGLTSDFGYQFQAGSGGGLVITKAALTVSAVTDSKVYDGTTGSGGAVQVTGLLGGDTASGYTQAFGSKNVLGQNGSTLSVNQLTGLVSDGNGGGNYAITFVNATGTIDKAQLTVSAVSDNKVFDGTTGSSVSAQASGLKGGDTITGLAESFDSVNAGSRNMVFGPITLNDGNGGGNYAVTLINATGTITPAPLTITANNATQVIGTPEPSFSASFGPFPTGLGPSALSGMLTFTTNAPNGSPGSFKIFANGLSSPNFDISFVPGTLLVTAANNSLPPVPFSMDEGNGTSVFSFTDPVLASLIVQASDTSSTGMKNFSTPTLDENGNPIGNLISFNSSFLEVCRTRVNLCR